MVKDNDTNEDGLEGIGGQINDECKRVKIGTENYNTHIYTLQWRYHRQLRKTFRICFK